MTILYYASLYVGIIYCAVMLASGNGDNDRYRRTIRIARNIKRAGKEQT